jgi:hypothetical protein
MILSNWLGNLFGLKPWFETRKDPSLSDVGRARPRLLEPLEPRLLLDGNANALFNGIETNFDAGLDEIGSAIQEIIEVHDLFGIQVPGLTDSGGDGAPGHTLRDLLQVKTDFLREHAKLSLDEIAGDDGIVSFKEYFVNVVRDRIDSFIDEWDPLNEDPDDVANDGDQFVEELADFFGGEFIDNDSFDGENVEDTIDLNVTSLGHSIDGAEATWSLGFSLEFLHELEVDLDISNDSLSSDRDALTTVTAGVAFNTTLGYDGATRDFSFTPDSDVVFSVTAKVDDDFDVDLFILEMGFTEADVNAVIQLLTTPVSPFFDSGSADSTNYIEVAYLTDAESSDTQTDDGIELEADTILDTIIVPIETTVDVHDDDTAPEGLVTEPQDGVDDVTEDSEAAPEAEPDEVQPESNVDGENAEIAAAIDELELADTTLLLDRISLTPLENAIDSPLSTYVGEPDDVSSVVLALIEDTLSSETSLIEEPDKDIEVLIDESIALSGIVAVSTQGARLKLE